MMYNKINRDKDPLKFKKKNQIFLNSNKICSFGIICTDFQVLLAYEVYNMLIYDICYKINNL